MKKEEVDIMVKFKYIKTAILVVFCSLVLTTGEVCTKKVIAEPVSAPTTSVQSLQKSENVQALAIVENPQLFLNKTVTLRAKFDKFSTLGLDYKPAFKSSEDYISFLIKRDDVKHDIPLSEMKLFLKRDVAEKFIDLKTDDEISITGTIFSDALGDAWIDVSNLTLIKKAPKKDGV